MGKLIGGERGVQIYGPSQDLYRRGYLKSGQMPICGVNYIYFTKVLHDEHRPFVEWPIVVSILVKYNATRFFLVEWAHFLTIFQFIKVKYNFLPMAYAEARFYTL